MPVSMKCRSMNCSATMPTSATMSAMTIHSNSRSMAWSSREMIADMDVARLLLRGLQLLDQPDRPDLAFVVFVDVLPRSLERGFVGHDVGDVLFLELVEALRIDLLAQIGRELSADLSSAFEQILLLFGELLPAPLRDVPRGHVIDVIGGRPILRHLVEAERHGEIEAIVLAIDLTARECHVHL